MPTTKIVHNGVKPVYANKTALIAAIDDQNIPGTYDNEISIKCVTCAEVVTYANQGAIPAVSTNCSGGHEILEFTD